MVDLGLMVSDCDQRGSLGNQGWGAYTQPTQKVRKMKSS
ncbi:uncharacterized protein METZ01_LOCUS253091, partial [marine metagenome]